MCHNFFLQEERVKEHIQELRCAAYQQRLVADLPRSHPSVGRRLIGRLGSYLVTWGMWLERVEQRDKRAAATYK